MPRPSSTISRSLGLLRRAPKIPTVIVAISLVIAAFAPWLAPHSAVDPNLAHIRLPPVMFENGSVTHLLGTDWQGRDILSRIIVGTRVSLSVAAMCILIGGAIGCALGLAAGYLGGWVDVLVMRAVDVFLAFPAILLALIFAVSVGPSFWVVVTVLAFMIWARYARLVRGEVLSWKERDFVAQARIAGASPLRIIVVHILLNVTNSVVVLSTLQVGWAIMVEASLSFLGAGVPPPTPTWGGMIADGRNYVDTLWWISVFPGIAVMLVVLSFNLFGDWLRDVLDPKLAQL
ncbi:MAG: ABC transporter permease [Proteobacteria bacterium]|nr:ABC transporter permease [Pseudomonadota bacterium]